MRPENFNQRQLVITYSIALVALLQWVVFGFISWDSRWVFSFLEIYTLRPPEIAVIIAYLYCFAAINYRSFKGYGDHREELPFLVVVTIIYWILLFPAAKDLLPHIMLLVILLTTTMLHWGLYPIIYPADRWDRWR